jgi:peptidyl-prolyl cis-trans isomerase C
MTKRTLYACCLAALLASGPAAAQEPTVDSGPGAAPPADTTIATINEMPVSLGLFRLFYAERLRAAGAENTPAFQNQAFNEFVNTVVTAQNAEAKGIDEDPNVKDALEIQRLQLLSRLALQDTADKYVPTEDELKQAYDKRYGKAARTEYKASHILVQTEDEAKKLIAELDKGAEFAELAKANSLGPTGKNGGDLGWFDSQQMVKPFTDAVKTLEPGNYSEAPVQTQFGWHVILLQETREAEPPSLDSVKTELTAALQREALAGYVAELREKATLDLNSDLIKANPVPEAGGAN